MRTLLHYWRPKWKAVQEKLNSLEANMSWWFIISRPFQGEKEESKQKWQCWLLSRPQAKTKEERDIWGWPLIFLSILFSKGANKMSDSTSSTSHSSHHEQHFSPHSPSSSPPTQLSSREKLVSPAAEDHTAQRHPTFIQPQDIDTQLTTGLAALVQETSPLAPYKIQWSAKRKARQAFSTIR